MESTGSSNEFFDKFSIRHHISVIVKELWKDFAHKPAILKHSRLSCTIYILYIIYVIYVLPNKGCVLNADIIIMLYYRLFHFMFCLRSDEFVRFVNMLINDTTFLLDESLNCLKSINETQQLMKNRPEWEALTRVRKWKRRR